MHAPSSDFAMTMPTLAPSAPVVNFFRPLMTQCKVKARIVELGGTVQGGTPAEFATIISEATDKWAKVIKFAGIKAE
jgi:hypothetical protein